MAKTTFNYKQVQLPEGAAKIIDEAHKLSKEKDMGLRKGDIWVMAAELVKKQISKNK